MRLALQRTGVSPKATHQGPIMKLFLTTLKGYQCCAV